ncbi:MAG: hypothetical protein CVU63_02525, partial [Deltaproteobacteria bacterium HGW-Deltaproteobacteria-20]
PPPDGIKGDSLQLAALLSRVVPTFPTVPFRLPIWASGGLDAENSGFDQCLDMGDLVRKVDAFLKDRPARLLLLPQRLAERLHRRGAHVTMLDVLAPRFRDANFWQAYEKVIVGVRSHELPLLIDVLLDRYQPARQPQRQRPKPRPGPPGISSELIEPSRVAVHRTRSCGPLPPPRDVEHPDLPHIAREDPFVGRERDFWSIQRHFEGMTRHSGDNIRIAAIDGPSGVGKTRLAFEYVRRFAELFPGGIYWIWAEGMDAAEISASLEQQTPVSLACFSQPSAPRGIGAPRLIILDGFLPSDGPCWTPRALLAKSEDRVLLTIGKTVDDDHERWAALQIPTLLLEGLPPWHVCQYMRSRLNPAMTRDAEAWKSLVKHIDGLPLSVRVATSVLRSDGRGISAFVENVEKHSELLNVERGGEYDSDDLDDGLDTDEERLDGNDRPRVWRPPGCPPRCHTIPARRRLHLCRRAWRWAGYGANGDSVGSAALLVEGIRARGDGVWPTRALRYVSFGGPGRTPLPYLEAAFARAGGAEAPETLSAIVRDAVTSLADASLVLQDCQHRPVLGAATLSAARFVLSDGSSADKAVALKAVAALLRDDKLEPRELRRVWQMAETLADTTWRKSPRAPACATLIALTDSYRNHGRTSEAASAGRAARDMARTVSPPQGGVLRLLASLALARALVHVPDPSADQEAADAIESSVPLLDGDGVKGLPAEQFARLTAMVTGVAASFRERSRATKSISGGRAALAMGRALVGRDDGIQASLAALALARLLANTGEPLPAFEAAELVGDAAERLGRFDRDPRPLFPENALQGAHDDVRQLRQAALAHLDGVLSQVEEMLFSFARRSSSTGAPPTLPTGCP